MKIIKKIILLSSVLNIPILAATELPQFLIEVKGGYQWAMDDNYKHSNPEDIIFGVYTGLQFTPSWGWDIGYQYHDKLKADATSINVKTWLIGSALRYDWYLQDGLSLYGRLGMAYWDMEKTRLPSDKSYSTGFSPLGEVGVSYNLNPNVRLSAGYQYIDRIGKSNTGKYDSYGALVNFTYTFDRATQLTTSTIEDSPVTGNKVITVKSLPQIHKFSTKTTNVLFNFDSIELNHDVIDQLV
ncbi:outer membrane beta-barrel protein, partial [Vibrio parahaemolyticus]|uniref:outer membrane beta-barrel protein n=1 Tax=Vibrio parahaemolyticus TaxID=670 RepID=UPI00111FE640